MNNLKLILENWNGFKKETFKESFLKEITQSNYSLISNWMADHGDKLSFDNLFNGKMRITFPFRTSKAEDIMSQIIGFFDENDWTLDFSTGTASKTEERIIPKGPKKGQTVKKERKQRIGALLKKVENLDIDNDIKI